MTIAGEFVRIVHFEILHHALRVGSRMTIDGELERTLRRSFARFACKLKDDDRGGVCAYPL